MGMKELCVLPHLLVSYGKHRRFVDVTNTEIRMSTDQGYVCPLVLHRHVAQLRDGLLSLVDLVLSCTAGSSSTSCASS